MAKPSPADFAQQFAQSTLSLAPVIILGSGASAAHGVPGMNALATHLSAAHPDPTWTTHEANEWKALLAELKRGVDLESALQSVRPTERQTHFIASETRQFLVPFDMNVLDALLKDRRCLPLTRLYRHLFDSTHKTLHVVTPNYDRLAEYAADAANISTFTGFTYGHLQNRAPSNVRITVEGRPLRTVAIWKVHGSLDWFQDSDHQIVGLRNTGSVPPDYVPLMVTPGLDKFRLTHGEPFRTILSCSDSALSSARAYLCVGYGFNDEHLQTKLVERCDRDAVPLIVLTKELSSAAKAFLSSGRCRRYLAIEEGATSGALAYTNAIPTGFTLDQPLWRLDQFLNHVIGVLA